MTRTRDDLLLDEAPWVTMTTTMVRDGTDGEIARELYEAFDLAQAPVFSGEQPHSFVVIKIVKG